MELKIEKLDNLIFIIFSILYLSKRWFELNYLLYFIMTIVLWLLSVFNLFLYIKLPKAKRPKPRKISFMHYWHVYCTFFFVTIFLLVEIVPKQGLEWYILNILSFPLFIFLAIWTFFRGFFSDS